MSSMRKRALTAGLSVNTPGQKVNVTASPGGDGGIEVSDGSDVRGFVTAELAAGVPTGNFS